MHSEFQVHRNRRLSREVFVKFEYLPKISLADRHKIFDFLVFKAKVQLLPYQNTKDQGAKIKSEEYECNLLNWEI